MCGLTINFKVIALNQHERARQKNVHANFVTTFHNVYGIVEKTNCDMCQHVWKEFPITRNKNTLDWLHRQTNKYKATQYKLEQIMFLLFMDKDEKIYEMTNDNTSSLLIVC
ncbi:CLUMA_CG014563, isoform A [Clunio marinus]|uniref:CLUMA_CG014563, isoform A n=1 Tax=Clunio marinus TaxID=568069 RepID=A0A1J1IN01_9DIPT|nr:CLUMA_CG014563, isoform A [Clunio marinus]